MLSISSSPKFCYLVKGLRGFDPVPLNSDLTILRERAFEDIVVSPSCTMFSRLLKTNFNY